ncbi:MAG: hypothetical protein SGCHY_001972 [Lobulomycetales sp.]
MNIAKDNSFELAGESFENALGKQGDLAQMPLAQSSSREATSLRETAIVVSSIVVWMIPCPKPRLDHGSIRRYLALLGTPGTQFRVSMAPLGTQFRHSPAPLGTHFVSPAKLRRQKRMRAKHNGLSLSPSLSKGSREERRISLGLDGPDGQKKKQARQMKFGKSVVQPQLDTVAEV